MIGLKWHGARPKRDLDQLDLEVFKDLQLNLGGLEKPSDLGFHHVFLGDDFNGPTVLVWGEEGDDDHFHCQYHETTEWVTLNGRKMRDD